MARNKHNRKDRSKRLSHFDTQLLSNVNMDRMNRRAMEDGPNVKKNWTLHDIKELKPLNSRQASVMEGYFTGNNIIASGSAGTGKTYVGLWLALQSILDSNEQQKQIIIVRSAVSSRDIGFLPGDEKEKLGPYEAVYKDILGDLTKRKTAYDDMVDAGLIKFMPTSFLRGLTWDNAVVVVDEVQNLTFDEINTVMTRVGKNSRLIVCGDIAQNDFSGTKEESGFDKFIRVTEAMAVKRDSTVKFDHTVFTPQDIVRSGFTKEWIIAKEKCSL